MKITSTQIKKTLLAVACYVLLFTLTWYFERSSPGGPCVPGAGFMFLMLLVPLAAASFFFGLIKTICYDKSNLTITLIHLAGFLISFLWLRSM